MHIALITAIALSLLASLTPEPRSLETVDGFLLKRLIEDEQHARSRYLQDYNQVDLDRILGTCRARFQIVGMYRNSQDGQQRAAYLLVVMVLAELYAHHPDYYEGWRPVHAKLGTADTPLEPT